MEAGIFIANFCPKLKVSYRDCLEVSFLERLGRNKYSYVHFTNQQAQRSQIFQQQSHNMPTSAKAHHVPTTNLMSYWLVLTFCLRPTVYFIDQTQMTKVSHTVVPFPCLQSDHIQCNSSNIQLARCAPFSNKATKQNYVSEEWGKNWTLISSLCLPSPRKLIAFFNVSCRLLSPTRWKQKRGKVNRAFRTTTILEKE